MDDASRTLTWKKCEPPWAEKGGNCPHGWKLEIPALASLTVPRQPSCADYLAIGLSLVPVMVSLAAFLRLFLKRGVQEALFIFLFPLLLGVSDLFLKMFFHQSRPEGTCLTTCGMPSGHSISICGVALYILYSCWRCSDTRIAHRRACAAISIALVFAVAWSRVHLHDHFVDQIIVGALCGSCISLCYIIFLRLVVEKPGNAAYLARILGLYDNYSLTARSSLNADASNLGVDMSSSLDVGST